MMKITISNHYEEGPCQVCGWPMYVGDYGFWSDETEALYCSKKCAADDAEASAESEPEPAAAPEAV